ncbi:alpha/beta hydrolase [Rhodoferax koreense]|uniref:Alpha/beta hydrolase n=1 Tax=Rhodoferax koreensis TaxID=1842727 RepID=A0A1P8JZK7_9BURK|nr:alpha/beta hydrolase [Rhodoferax koreense]APW39198.1 alpha/beta hydrolase [Rhodoferax koreense]
MSEPQLHHVFCPGASAKNGAAGREGGPLGHRMAYWQWGDAHNPHVIVCVHGLTRQGRDFDVLAGALSRHARVICPDVVGRGHSDWLQDGGGYQIPVYAGDMLALLAELHRQSPIRTLDWVGTSMGGLIGLAVAGTPGLPLPAPVRRLVLNDVGPALELAALQRIGGYVGQTGRFDNLQQAADAMWAISKGFGPHTPAQWIALSRHMVRPLHQPGGTPFDPLAEVDGPLTLHYDPAIGDTFRDVTEEATAQGEKALWQLYDHVGAQTLLLRGAQSDLLSASTAYAMAQRGPRARLVEFDGVGHAPTLVADEQVAAVTAFLVDGPPADLS